jgi:hypothetical protein
MLRRIAMTEDESSAASSPGETPSLDFEKLDLTSNSSGSAMSSIFSSGKQSSSRGSSPSRQSSSFLPIHHRRSSSHGSIDRQKKKDDHLSRWLQGGNVIYKSVGLGLMDLTVGMHLIGFAKEKGVGTHIEGF